MSQPAQLSTIDDVRVIGTCLNGRYVLSGRGTKVCAFACRVRSISAWSAVLIAPVNGGVGEVIKLNFADLGILVGRISRVVDWGFAVDLIATDEARARLATRLRWLKRRTTQNVPDLRQLQTHPAARSPIQADFAGWQHRPVLHHRHVAVGCRDIGRIFSAATGTAGCWPSRWRASSGCSNSALPCTLPRSSRPTASRKCSLL